MKRGLQGDGGVKLWFGSKTNLCKCYAQHLTNLHFLTKFNVKFKLIILLLHINSQTQLSFTSLMDDSSEREKRGGDFPLPNLQVSHRGPAITSGGCSTRREMTLLHFHIKSTDRVLIKARGARGAESFRGQSSSRETALHTIKKETNETRLHGFSNEENVTLSKKLHDICSK